jgi:hypothetical protein
MGFSPRVPALDTLLTIAKGMANGPVVSSLLEKGGTFSPDFLTDWNLSGPLLLAPEFREPDTRHARTKIRKSSLC